MSGDKVFKLPLRVVATSWDRLVCGKCDNTAWAIVKELKNL